MKKSPLYSVSFLCELREYSTGRLIEDFVTLEVLQTRPLDKNKITYFNRSVPPKGRSFTNRRNKSAIRDSGPFYSIVLCTKDGQDRLFPHMKTVATLTYTHDHGIAELSIVETQGGHIALVCVGDSPRYWTSEKSLIAETVFEAEDYIYENLTNVKRILHETDGSLHKDD